MTQLQKFDIAGRVWRAIGDANQLTHRAGKMIPPSFDVYVRPKLIRLHILFNPLVQADLYFHLERGRWRNGQLPDWVYLQSCLEQGLPC